MDRRNFLKKAMAGAAVLSAGCAAKNGGAELSGNRPNVLIINIDDMGYGDMSCHGNPYFKTPNIDKLHGESVRFTQFHAAPMCTPTRGQLISGMDALKNGSRWVGTENTHLRTDIPAMPEIFKGAGYSTGLFGKWHIGDNYPMRPQDRGFDEVVWFPQQEVGTVNDYWGNDYFDDTYEHNGEHKKYEGYCTDVWFDLAMDWMKKKQRKGQPFLCWVPTNVVHGPYFVEQQYRDRVDIPNAPNDIDTFFAMIVNLDDNMGKLDAFLEKTGLKDNTIVIFMTDNGGTGGYNWYNAGMRGLKTMLWEGGHRVPCFVRWPNGKISGGRDINELAQVQDLLPTLLDLCGVPYPSRAQFDGDSLARQLKQEAPMPDRMLVIQFQRRLEIQKWDACIMQGPWRLVNAIDADPKDSPEQQEILMQRKRNRVIKLELYNIEKDPHQDRDVIDWHPEVVARLKAHYEKWWDSVQPHLKIERPIVIGNDAENPSLLAASAWAKTYFTQIDNVLDGRAANGYWNIAADRAGEYEFELRRWPKEADTPIAGKTDITFTDTYTYGRKKEGTALAITEARVQIQGSDQRKAVGPEDKACVFKLRLNKGPAKLRTWFYDKEGKQLCGAYYVYVTRK